MYFSIDAQARELERLLEDFEDALRRINNFDAEDRRTKLRICAQLQQQIKTVRTAYVLDGKAIEDKEEQLKRKEWLKEKNSVFRSLVDEYEARKNEIDREILQAEADAMEDTGGLQDPSQLTTQKVIAQGDRIQDETQEAVNRIRHLVADAEEVGLATAQKMDDQLGQMGHVAEGLNDVEYNVGRAKKTAATIARNASTDRCIQVEQTDLPSHIISKTHPTRSQGQQKIVLR